MTYEEKYMTFEKGGKNLMATKKNFFSEITPAHPVFPKDENERRDWELWSAVSTAIHMCGYSGEDVAAMSFEVMKEIGRQDLLPSCDR